MPNKSTASAGLLKVSDEVVCLGVRLGAVIERVEDLCSQLPETVESGNFRMQGCLETAQRRADDEIDAIRRMLTITKATTLAGAALQIVEAMNLISEVWSEFPEKDYRLETDMRAIERLLFSALDVVDGAADRKLAEIAPDFGSLYLNPWVPVEERHKSVASEAAIAS